MDFTNNTHKSQLVAVDVPRSSSCGTLEVTSVTFKDNQANDNVAVFRVGSASVLSDVRIEDNKRIENGRAKEFLVFATSDTPSNSLTVDKLVLKRNQMPILKAESSSVEILNSNFTENEVKSDDARMFQFHFGSRVKVRDSSFKNNTGSGKGMIALESDQSIEIHDSVFAFNSRFGSMIFSSGSKLYVMNSTFTSNDGTSDGGVIHLDNSTASITDAVFKDNNSSANGGSVFAINSSNLKVANSTFVKNEAHEGGCFYIEDSNIEVLSSTFHRNMADVDGGAIRVEQGGVACNDSVFEDNNSLDEGAAIHIENA